MKGLGCFIIVFAGMFGAALLVPIATLVIKSGDLVMIAQVVYLEMAIFSLVGGVVLAFRQSDFAYGLGTGVAVTAAILVAVYLSYNLPAQSAFDLGGNSHYTHYIGIPLSLGCCWIGYSGTHFIRKRSLERKEARKDSTVGALCKRCAKCNRRKPLGQRWEIFKEKLYCPDCLIKVRKLAEDEERIEALCESQVRSGMEDLRTLRQRLEDVAQGKVRYVEALQGAYQTLAAQLLDGFNRITDRQLQEIKTTDRSWFGKSQALANLRQRVSGMLVEPTMEFLANSQIPRGEEGMRAVLAQCLDLARKSRIDYHYFKGPHGFPIDFMIGLAKLDRKTTVDELCQLVSNPDETPWVLNQAIIALGGIGDRSATDALLPVLGRKDEWGTLVSGAACALVDLQDPSAVLPVIQSIDCFSTGNYDHWNAREYIADGLGTLLSPETELYEQVSAIWKEKKDSGKWEYKPVLDVLERSLFEAGGSAGIAIALERADCGEYSSSLKGVEALAKYAAVPDVFSALCRIASQPRTFYQLDPETQVTSEAGTNTAHRIISLEAIAQQDNMQAKPILSLAAGDSDPQVCTTATRLLQEIEGKDKIP